MVDFLLSFVAFLVFFAAVVWYFRRALMGDIGVSPTKVFGALAIIFLAAIYMYTDISLLTFFLLLLAIISAYKVFSSVLYGDLAWGYVLLFLLAAVLLLSLSLDEFVLFVEGAKSHLYSNSTNTSQVLNLSG